MDAKLNNIVWSNMYFAGAKLITGLALENDPDPSRLAAYGIGPKPDVNDWYLGGYYAFIFIVDAHSGLVLTESKGINIRGNQP